MEVYVEILNTSPRDILVKDMSCVYMKGDTTTKQKTKKKQKNAKKPIMILQLRRKLSLHWFLTLQAELSHLFLHYINNYSAFSKFFLVR